MKTRYYIEFESKAVYDRLKTAAKAKGTYSEEHSDWFQPQEVLEYRDVEGGKKDAQAVALRIARHESLYGMADIRERFKEVIDGIEDEDTRLVESVESPS